MSYSVPQSQCDVLIQRDVPVPMRDGASLITDIYRPGENGDMARGKFPVILVRTCYDKDVPIKFFAGPDYYVPRGYVVAIQDTRGRYKSPGTFYHGVYETHDGHDTIEWIAAQPWSNGRVGMIGVSYLAAVPQAVAVSGTKHLSSMFHVQAPLSYYQDGVRRNGAFIQMMVPIAFLFPVTSKEAAADPIVKKAAAGAVLRGPNWLERWPFGKGRTVLKHIPDYERFLFDTWVHCDYDDFYKRNALWEPHEYLHQWADIPSYFVGGWWDLYKADLFFTTLSKQNKQPLKLLIGPWAHGTSDSTLGDVDFGTDARSKRALLSTRNLFRQTEQAFSREEFSCIPMSLRRPQSTFGFVFR